MSNVVVFQVIGQYGNGKDTFGDALEAAIYHVTGQEPCRLQYSIPVKEIAIILGMPREVAYGGETKRRAWKKFLRAFGREADAREWLQWIGTEFGRMQVGEDIWVERLAATAQQKVKHNTFIITDTRFFNEIRKTGDFLPTGWRFVRIRVVRPGHEVKDAHQSEAEQLLFPDAELDELVLNDASVEDLVAKARVVAQKYCVAG